MTDDAPKTYRRFRFSLLNLVMMTTIVALVITVYALYREVTPLRTENKRLNEERGTLVVGDPTRVHAIRIPAGFAGDRGTSFRVFVPEGKTYLAIAAVNDIPIEGFPNVKRRPTGKMILGQAGANAFAVLPAGEHQISIGTEEFGRAKAVRLAIRSTASANIPLDLFMQTPDNRWPKTRPEAFSTFGDSVGGTTESVAPTEPMVLKRYRLIGTVQNRLDTFSTPEPAGPLDGLMLWIEPMELSDERE